MKLLPIILFIALIQACSTNRNPLYSGFYFPYKPDIYQGNLIEKKTLEKLKLGMSKEQVLEIMGQSVLTDSFNKNHLIYIAFAKIKGDKVEYKKVSIFFKDNKLIEIKQ